MKEYSDDELDEITNKVGEWGVAFSESTYFGELTEEQKQESEDVVMFFTECRYSCLGLPPEEWGDEGVRVCCVGVFPRKLSMGESFFRSVAPAKIQLN